MNERSSSEVGLTDASPDVVAVPDPAPVYAPPPPGAPESELIAWANALPLARAMNIVCTRLTPAEGTFVVDEMPLPLNPNGALHGGVVAAIADQCLGAVSVANSPEQLSVTGSLHGQFHRPAFPPVTVRARLISGGRRLIFVELEMADRSGRRCATFQATMAVGGAERRDGVG